jgi:DNA-binding protein H-NS
MNLASLSDDALATLITDAQAEQQARFERRKADVLETFRTQAEALGLDPASLAKALAKRGNSRPRASSHADGRSSVKPKYRNPQNPSETWAGRGAKPKWYEAHLARGGKAAELLIADNAA